jgi:hypothetical protein
MGNRAVIAMQQEGIPKEDSPAIYLHWNGGRDSVEAFLESAKKLGARQYDDSYGFARLVQIIANFFGGTTSIGVATYRTLDTDNYDNGVYWIKDLNIIEREFKRGEEQNEYPLNETVDEIIGKNNMHFGKPEE